MGGSDKNPFRGVLPWSPPPVSTERFEVGPTINGMNYSPGMPPRTDGSFEFPVANSHIYPNTAKTNNSIHYLLEPRGPLPVGGTIRLDYEVSGPAEALIGATNGTAFTQLAVMVQRAGDDWSGIPPKDGWRWYSGLRGTLTAGRHVLDIPLTWEDMPFPMSWGSVGGIKASEAQFLDTLANAATWAITFGDDDGAGHGVASTQPGVRFTLHSLAVQ